MTENGLSIGFVGFGEAGFHIAKGLHGAGVARLTAYDINAETPAGYREVLDALAEISLIKQLP
jgi:3-hydroxyisobutyrate dehydrogenase-like beta-hydroxyacid dehydrogenase